MYYKFFIVFVWAVFLCLLANAQSFSLSPYSKFGIGDVTYNPYLPGLSMGYTSIAQRSNRYINSLNPAAATATDTMSFITDISIVGRTHHLKSGNLNNTQTNTDISYLAMGFPIVKNWKTYIGLSPISNVGYKINDEQQIDTLELSTTYKGDGGFNELFISNGFILLNKKYSNKFNNTTYHYFHNFSIGIKASYIFGSLDKYTTAVFPNDQNIFDLYKTERFIVSGFNPKAGIQYEFLKQEEVLFDKKNKIKIIAGATYSPLTNINAKQTSLVTKYLNIQGSITKDTIQNIVNKKGKIQFPGTIGFGFTLETNNKFTWSTDINFQQWSATHFFNEPTNLKNSIFIGTGIQYIPDPTKFYNYWKMINYRMGGYYQQSYLNVSSTNISEFGITFGLGLPITKTDKGESTMIRRRLPPMLNLALSYGSRGTEKNSLIKEQFIQFSIGLNLHDIWFVKRKYN